MRSITFDDCIISITMEGTLEIYTEDTNGVSYLSQGEVQDLMDFLKEYFE